MAFTNPDRNVEQLGLTGRERVAVFGSGAGGHSLAAARAMRGNGRVYALDSRSAMVEKLKSDVAKLRVSGIEVKCVNFEQPGGSGLYNNSFDAAIIPNTLYAAHNKVGVLREAFRILKPEGKAMIVDWKDSYGGMGPQPEYVVKVEQAKELAEKAGFTFDREFDAGTQHYGLIYFKSAKQHR